MNILINILAVLFCLILGYIFGSIPTAVWIGKIFFHRDPRLEGSKNAGGTNAGRLFGKKNRIISHHSRYDQTHYSCLDYIFDAYIHQI